MGFVPARPTIPATGRKWRTPLLDPLFMRPD